MTEREESFRREMAEARQEEVKMRREEKLEEEKVRMEERLEEERKKKVLEEAAKASEEA